MVETHNIFFIGPMGAGKSTVGRQLAQQLHMDFFDSDEEIERRTGADISWVFDVEGEGKFREREENIIYELASKENIVLATGGGAVKSVKTRNFLASRGYVVYLETSVKKQLFRTQYDKKRPLLQIKEGLEGFLKRLACERNPIYEDIADLKICTDENNVKSIVSKILFVLDCKNNR